MISKSILMYSKRLGKCVHWDVMTCRCCILHPIPIKSFSRPTTCPLGMWKKWYLDWEHWISKYKFTLIQMQEQPSANEERYMRRYSHTLQPSPGQVASHPHPQVQKGSERFVFQWSPHGYTIVSVLHLHGAGWLSHGCKYLRESCALQLHLVTTGGWSDD